MAKSRLAFMLLAAVAGLTAQQLPGLRIEAVGGGSILHVTNQGSQPLTAYLIELVDYPGSSYSLLQDDAANTIAPGAGKAIPTTNMTIGAAPEYVKITAAMYADGSTAGDAAKVALVAAHRKAVLETTRELIARVQKAETAGKSKPALAAELKQWAGSQPQTTSRRLTAAGVAQTATRQTISHAITSLENGATGELLAELRAAEQWLSR